MAARARVLACAAVALAWVGGCSSDSPPSQDAGPSTDASSDAPLDAPLTDAPASDADAAALEFLELPDTYDAVHAFLTFDYLVAKADVATAGAHADFVWGAGSGNVPLYRAATQNPKIALSSYMVFDEVTDTTQTIDAWKKSHPDWIVYQCDKTTPAYAYGTRVPLDVSNPAVIDWQVQTFAVPAAAAGYDAIAADEFELPDFHGACGVYRNGTWTQLYSGKNPDPAYADAMIKWAQTFAQRLHALTPKPLALVANYYSQFPPDDPHVSQAVDALDGVISEGTFTAGTTGAAAMKESVWTSAVALMEAVQARGKPFFDINQFDDFNDGVHTDGDVEWALASYLMGKEHSAFVYAAGYTTLPIKYGADAWRPEYAAAALGSPCGAMQHVQGAYYTRLFQHGMSLVNPTATDASATLPPGTWTDLKGSAVTGSPALAAHTGLVLLDSGAPHC